MHIYDVTVLILGHAITTYQVSRRASKMPLHFVFSLLQPVTQCSRQINTSSITPVAMENTDDFLMHKCQLAQPKETMCASYHE